jgi:hypothetical protein
MYTCCGIMTNSVKSAKHGFLTERQRQYMCDEIQLNSSNSKKVMNYRIREAFKKSCKTYSDDFEIYKCWLDKRHVSFTQNIDQSDYGLLKQKTDSSDNSNNLDELDRNSDVLFSHLKQYADWGKHNRSYVQRLGDKSKKKVSIPLHCPDCGKQWKETFYDDGGYYHSDFLLHPLFRLNRDVLKKAVNLKLDIPAICEQALKDAIKAVPC